MCTYLLGLIRTKGIRDKLITFNYSRHHQLPVICSTYVETTIHFYRYSVMNMKKKVFAHFNLIR